MLNIAAWSIVALLLVFDILTHLWAIRVARVTLQALKVTQAAIASINTADAGAEKP